MNEIYVIQSESGNEYKLQLTSERGGLVASWLLDKINADNIEVVEIDLVRTKGVLSTSFLILEHIEKIIAEVLQSHPNIIICFFCDFIQAIPAMNKRKKDMTVQQYRSQLFSRMFERFASHHCINNIHNRVVIIEGVSEPYYFHVISRREHLQYVEMITEGLHRDFDK